MKQLFIIASLGLLMSCNSASDGSKEADTTHQSDMNRQDTTASAPNHMKDMHDAMSGMMQQMKSMSPTGDPDHDFAIMMKHHHQGAIDMAKAEIAGGNNDSLKQMAQKMIDDQQREIDEFNRFMQSHQPSGNSDFGKKSMGMMTEMSDMKMESGSLDAMFASMMIPHHQDAIEMSKEYLKVGKNADIKKIAGNIISTHPKEIQQLQQWLNRNKGAGS